MTAPSPFEIFCIVQPGLEPVLCDELQGLGFGPLRAEPGGVAFDGGWSDVWRANLLVRGASRILARLGSFPVFHLAQLDKRARRFPWGDVLRPDVPVRVDVTCRNSKIYHAKAVSQRVERAISEAFGAPIARDAELKVRVRIDDNVCTFSIDTSGELLHRRGFKEAVAKAPMRESLAALFLRECGYRGEEPVLDPMCGSGTFLIEAAEIAQGLAPGRRRSFAFAQLASFDADAWSRMRGAHAASATDLCFFGSDRNPGAVEASRTNARRAGVDGVCAFEQRDASDAMPPDGPPGLVIVNPPYGDRIGSKKALYPVYDAFGKAMMQHFSGWRVGVITSDPVLAKAARLPFGKPGPIVDHGGIKIRLYQTKALR